MSEVWVTGDGEKIEIDPEALEDMERSHEEYERRLQEAIDEEWDNLRFALDDEDLLVEDRGKDR